jgi:two-component system chemotaxis response regulator CheY
MALIGIIDDDLAMQRIVRHLLVNAGHAVVCAADAASARTLIAEQPLSMILLDMNLPGVNGLTLLSAIRATAHQKETPVLILSAEANPTLARQTREQGGNGYLVKPIRGDVLLVRIEETLEAAKRPAA